jgi:hypothetical protein
LIRTLPLLNWFFWLSSIKWKCIRFFIWAHVLFSLPSDDDDDGRGDSDNVVDIFIMKAYRAY